MMVIIGEIKIEYNNYKIILIVFNRVVVDMTK